MYVINTSYKEEDIFNIFMSNQTDHEKFKAVLKYVTKGHMEREKQLAGAVYDNVIRPLANSSNNAGWEERHYDQIDFLKDQAKYLIEIVEDEL